MGLMEEKVMGTVFLYRINVALAALLIFINLQIFINVFFVVAEELPPEAPLVSGLMLLGAFGYGFWAMNSMLTKIIIDDAGLEYRTLLRRRFIAPSSIDKAIFHRKDQKHMKISLYRNDGRNAGKPFVIIASKFKENQPLIDFCKQFDRG
jgi:hypothetical protein